MKSYTPKNHKERVQNLDMALRTRGVRLDRGKRNIDRILKGRIIKNNPQKKFNIKDPDFDSIEHYSQSDYSIESASQKTKIPSRALPRIQSRTNQVSRKQNQQTLDIGQNQILLQKARVFVNRLRKQKQYEEGKALIRRQKQEQKKITKTRQQEKHEQKQLNTFQAERYNRIMENILYHEQKVSDRLKKSFKRYQTSQIRMKTQGNDDLQSKRASKSTLLNHEPVSHKSNGRVDKTVLKSLKKQVGMLQSMIDSLQS